MILNEEAIIALDCGRVFGVSLENDLERCGISKHLNKWTKYKIKSHGTVRKNIKLNANNKTGKMNQNEI